MTHHAKRDLKQEIAALGQTVLVLQGGGALGAYQIGVYQVLHEAEIDPDWVVGTSIGAINAALIAGGPREAALDRLREFWVRVEHGKFFDASLPNWFAATARNILAVTQGVPAFYEPNPAAFASARAPLGPENAGYYSVAPLRATLEELIDFDRINHGPMRLTVGACNVQTSEMIYFDSKKTTIDVRHILASGALPPAFPATRIDGELYWDGGILSNTPVEIVFDDEPRHDSLVFAVHLWNPHGAEPGSIWEVMNRQKDVQYSSRAVSHIRRQRQLHRLRHVVSELVDMVPEAARKDVRFAELANYGCTTTMHVVRLLAPALNDEDHTKDIDFSPEGIRQRWQAGYQHTLETLEMAPWRGDFDPGAGFILHKACGGALVQTPAAA